MYDIALISYNESQIIERYTKIVNKFPRRRIFRIHNIKGIHQAHIEAANTAKTNMFYVVDADANILPTFKFDIKLDASEEDIVHVWRSRNPVNGLEYGYGGVKLLPTSLTLNMNTNTADMTTSISGRFKIINEVSNITEFNTDPLSTWRSSFRECVKLSSKIIDGQIDTETQHRLDVWRFNNSTADFAEYSRGGASAGEWYGKTHKQDVAMLSKINDYDWLEQQFKDHIHLFPPETFK
jgi:hypothetical protein